MASHILQMAVSFVTLAALSAVAVGTFICYYDGACERRQRSQPEASDVEIKSAVTRSVSLKAGVALAVVLLLWLFRH